MTETFSNEATPTYFSMRQAPSILGLDVGRNIFMRVLREKGILDKENQPKPELIDQGYFTLKLNIKNDKFFFLTPLITWEGLRFIRDSIPLEELNDSPFVIVDDEGNPVEYQQYTILNFYLNE